MPKEYFSLSAAKKQRIVNAAFIQQAEGDIWRKLQKLEGFTGMQVSQLLEAVTEGAAEKMTKR